jgi:hypothetical protein
MIMSYSNSDIFDLDTYYINIWNLIDQLSNWNNLYSDNINKNYIQSNLQKEINSNKKRKRIY